MKVSNVHKAYGDESVYQVLVDYGKHIEDGEDISDWTDIGYDKIRAVKDSNGLYMSVIRASNGELMFEGRSVFDNPFTAIEFGREVYKSKFLV